MPELSVVVPTLNEQPNLLLLIDDLRTTLQSIDFEIIVVDDDSQDGTAAYARELAQEDARIRVLQRIGRRGLASAVIEGMLASSAPFMAVMDGDRQHDHTILPAMLSKIKSSSLDIVVASRAVDGGSMGEFSSERVALSSLGRKLSRAVCRVDVSDPMSGFFLLSRKYFEEVMYSLSGTGFKILLDLLSSSERPVRVAEVGYTFGVRRAGESKLDIVVGLEYMELLLDKLLRGWLPVRYVIFGCVGALGALINAAISYVLMRWAKTSFDWAQMTAGVAVIGLNFLLNNRFTFRAFRLRGWQMAGGMASFYAACSIGLFTNLTIAMALVRSGLPWYSAGLIGVIAGSVWNYWMGSLFVWKVAQRRLNERILAHRAQPARFESQPR